MKNNYFQIGTDSAVEIFEKWGLRVVKVTPPERKTKDVFTRDWAESQGVDVMFPTTRVYQASTVTIEFFARKTSGLVKDLQDFFNTIMAANEFQFASEYANRGYRMYYSGESIEAQRFRATSEEVHFEVEFIVANPLSFSSFGTVRNSSTFDVYLSDGTTLEDVTGSITPDLFAVLLTKEISLEQVEFDVISIGNICVTAGNKVITI